MKEEIQCEHVFKVGPGETLINGEYYTFSTFTKITFYELMYEREYDAERGLYIYRYIHNGDLKWHAVPLTDLSEQEKKELLFLANMAPNSPWQEQEENLEDKVYYLPILPRRAA